MGYQARKSQATTKKQLERDRLPKQACVAKMDAFLRNQKHEQEHLARHRDSVLASHAFHANRNSLHTFRHNRAAQYRDEVASDRCARFGDLANKKSNQAERFVERYVERVT